ncbi:MAG: PQQ-binding-like beta-propeller repeat protein [Chitinispirillaceae bacterium]
MMRIKNKGMFRKALVVGCLGAMAATAADWPMFRYESNRSAISPEQLADNLNLQWIRKHPKPEAAWDNQKEVYCYGGPGYRVEQKVSFDIAYQPVVMGDKMFFGSPNNDRVTAVKLSDGSEEWRFYAGGPIRFAPVAMNGKVYFGSDDGYLYCLDADNGEQIWKFQAAASDRKVLGNDRLISLWPLRGAPVIPTHNEVENPAYQRYIAPMMGDRFMEIMDDYDAVEEDLSNGRMDMGSSDLEIGREHTDRDDYQIVGLRFSPHNSLWNIPKNAAISNAFIQFTVDETKGGTEPITVEIYGELGSASGFSNSTNNLSDRTNLTSTVVEWTIPAWTKVGDAGDAQRTPDLTGLLAEIMSKPEYTDGDPINIFIRRKSGTGTRCAESMSAAPRMVVETEDAEFIGELLVKPEQSFTPLAENDAVEERVANGSMYMNSSDLELHRDGSRKQLIGIRFPTSSENWQLDKNNAVTNAFVQFTVDETKNGSDPLVIEIVGEKGNASAFGTSSNNLSGREANLTSTVVEWNVGNWTKVGERGAAQQTPDISAIINEIITSDGFVDEGFVNLFFRHKSGDGVRCAESFRDNKGRPALFIESDGMVCLADTTPPEPLIIEDNPDSNIIYVAAGMYSFEGAAVYGLNAETGEVVMKNDGRYMFFTANPHGGSEGISGMSPQGYLTTTKDNGILVPNGRALPMLFDRATGDYKYWRHGGMSKGLGGYHVSAQGDFFYVRDHSFNLENGDKVGAAPAQFNEWDLQITAGGKVYRVEGTRDADFAGEYDRDFTVTDGSWSATVNGMPKGLVAANGKLLVTTVTGDIYCFGEQAVSDPQVITDPVVESGNLNRYAAQADRILSNADYQVGSKGICVVANCQDARLLEALSLKAEDMTIVAFQENGSKVAQMRRYLDERGIYGHKVQVLSEQFHAANLPPYMASIVVMDGMIRPGRYTRKMVADYASLRSLSGKAFVSAYENLSGEELVDDGDKYLRTITEAYRVLRPYGGSALIRARYGDVRLLLGDDANAEFAHGGGYLKISKAGALAGSSDWTHEYYNAAQTNFSTDSLVKAPLGVLWFGGSADNTNDKILPRHGHGQSPQVSGGRYFIMGKDLVRCVDQYTGRVLWEKDLPNIGEFSEYTEHQAGNIGLGDYLIAMPDYVYVLSSRNSCDLSRSCLKLDPATGETLAEFTLPEGMRWGMISVHGDNLIATAQVMAFDEPMFDCWVYWYKGFSPVGPGGMKTLNYAYSKKIFVLDRFSGEQKWDVEADNGFFHRAIVAGNNKLFAIDKTDEEALAILDRMGEENVEAAAAVKAYDMNDGTLLWADSSDVFARYLAYSEKHDILLQTSRKSRDYYKNEPNANKMIAHRGTTGETIWSIQPEDQTNYFGGPVMLDDTLVYTQDGNLFGALNLLNGEWHSYEHPVTGDPADFFFVRHYGCTHAKGCENLITFRTGNAGMFDLGNMSGVHTFGGFKSGCTPNEIPGGGILNVPEYTRTCGCSYQLQTSLAMYHTPEAEIWTTNRGLAVTWDGGVLKTAGINFGATGDRKDDDGILWMEFPYGEVEAGFSGQQVPLQINVEGNDVKYYRHHSAGFDGSNSWIASSGIEGDASISVDLAYDAPAANDLYDVTLYFAEPDAKVVEGERVFTVSVNGSTVSNMDIVKEAGKANKAVTRKFSGVSLGEKMEISLSATSGKAILSGISIQAQ